ncbi:MAG: hypothetical protein ACK58L_04775 [Planctomycetota bacterium]
MKTNVGVWVDHSEAMVVTLGEGGETSERVRSKAESQMRRSSDHRTGTFEPLAVPADDVKGKIFAADLNHFYDDVFTRIKGAEALLILGPGEAKTELKKRIEGKYGAPQSIHVETADRMSDAQVAATVRKHFLR